MLNPIRMKYPIILSFIFLALATGCRDRAIRTDHIPGKGIIRPGERVGAITASSSAEDIRETYGASEVVEQQIYIAEGESMLGLILYPGSAAELEIAMDSSGHPDFIRISKDMSPWRTEEGVTVGTRLDELERINGAPFSFNGFEWDYGGLVTDWGGGKLPPGLIIALTPVNYEALPDDMLGEVRISSDDTRLQSLDIRVGSLVVTF